MTTKLATMITCQQLVKHFATNRGPVTALMDINLELAANEFVCIVGPSGCGKSTLLRLVAGLLEPSSGTIQFATEKPTNKQRTAMIFQEHGLFPWMTVLENMAFGLEMQNVRKSERESRAYEFVEKLGLTGFAHRYPHELSGGMRQRVGIARAWLADADILLMDEPFGALDAQTRLLLQEELLRIWKDERKTVLYVTHDIEEAILLGDRVLIMSSRPGQILEELPIPLARPRNLLEQATTEEQTKITELRWHIWNRLKNEVQLRR